MKKLVVAVGSLALLLASAHLYAQLRSLWRDIMTRAIATVAACAALLWTGTALATPTPQQHCDNARITAWKVYTSCVDAGVAKKAKGVSFDLFKAFWNCRHAYFNNWTVFQTTTSLATSTCQVGVVPSRYTDNGDQTVTDNLTTLVWEKKDNAGGLSVHDRDNTYSWSTGSPYKGNGSAFFASPGASFLVGGIPLGLNSAGFAGANDWRLPTLAELQTIMPDFTCTGKGGSATCVCTGPCIDPALDAANTQSSNYWSATSSLPNPVNAWFGNFLNGGVGTENKTTNFYVRAVRGGL